MPLLGHAIRLVIREPRRSLAALIGVAMASALVTSVLLFGTASGATVTRRALAGVTVDAQVVLADGASADAARSILTADPAVKNVMAFDLVHFDAAALDKAGTATQTSTGVLVGLDPGYDAATGLFTASSGAAAPGQVMISRDLASNIGAVPGDQVAFTLPGGGSVSLTVSGIVSTVGADLVLGPIDAAHRAAGANAPTNVAVLARADLEKLVLPKIPAGATAVDPSASSSNPTTTKPVFAPDPAVRRELQLQLDHAQLPGDPVEAQKWLDTVRRRLERQGAGTFQVVDDAGASLEPLAADLAWGQILFIFLALPGIILALALSRLAADATADTTRRHAALLRARGASTRQLRLVFVGAAVVTALLGSLIGVLVGTVVGLGLFGSALATTDPVGTIIRVAIVAIALTTLLASIAAFIPLRSQLREEIALGRQELQRVRGPIWQRAYLDVIALIAGAIVYVVAGGTGIHPVLNAEGNPTVTLALTSFVAPLLFWSGGTLLLLRLVTAALRRSERLSRAMGRLLGPGGALAGRSLGARATTASRAIVVLALATSFATSVLVFDATYRQQQRVDAELTLGADAKAVPTAPTTAAAVTTLRGPGSPAPRPSSIGSSMSVRRRRTSSPSMPPRSPVSRRCPTDSSRGRRPPPHSTRSGRSPTRSSSRTRPPSTTASSRATTSRSASRTRTGTWSRSSSRWPGSPSSSRPPRRTRSSSPTSRTSRRRPATTRSRSSSSRRMATSRAQPHGWRRGPGPAGRSRTSPRRRRASPTTSPRSTSPASS